MMETRTEGYYTETGTFEEVSMAEDAGWAVRLIVQSKSGGFIVVYERERGAEA